MFKEPETSHEIPIKFARVLQRTLREALAYGYWLQDLYLFERRGKKYKGKITLSEGDDIKESLEDFIDDGIWNDIIPEEAVNWINDYVPHLANVFNEDVLNAVRDVTQKSLIEGSTLQERIKALQDAHAELAEMTKHRIEAIARTEITRADSLGRIISAKANDDVIGFEFSAVLDNRTTPYCLERHGLVMRIDDSRLPENTPPLHVHCRSLLNPLTIYDYPDGLLTSHEFDEISAGKQRPEDVEIIRELLYGHDYYAKKSSKEEPHTDITEEIGIISKNIKEANEKAVKLGIAHHADFRGLDINAVNVFLEEIQKTKELFPDLPAFDFIGSHQNHANFLYNYQLENRWERNKDKIIEKYVDNLSKKNDMSLINAHMGDIEKFLKEKYIEHLKSQKIIKKYRVESGDYASYFWNKGAKGINLNMRKFASSAMTQETIEVMKVDVAEKWSPVGCGTMQSLIDHEMGHRIDDLVGASQDSEIINLSKLGNSIKKFMFEHYMNCWNALKL